MQKMPAKLSELPRGLRTRFAPSPTGQLHLGHIASAIFVWGIAQRLDAELILRIEDHDQQRCRPEFEAALLEDLTWLGFPLPKNISRQSQQQHRYEQAMAQIKHRVYACRCSRKDVIERTAQHGDELRYDNHCRTLNLAAQDNYGLRISLDHQQECFDDLLLGPQSQFAAEQCGDLLIRDRDGNWTYNFAVAVDDMTDGIDLVIRGQDILHATGRQLQLQKMLGSQQFPHFLHHPLIWESPERKLSKRDGSTSIASMREAGRHPEQLLGEAAFGVGLINEPRELCIADLKELFS